MKYRIYEHYEGIDIITEDGGLVFFCDCEDGYRSDYYQDKLTQVKEGEYVWDGMTKSKIYTTYFAERPSNEWIIQDALNWLVVPQPDKWERDDSLFIDLIPNE